MPMKPEPPPMPPPPKPEYNGAINAADLLCALGAFLIVGLATYLYFSW